MNYLANDGWVAFQTFNIILYNQEAVTGSL
ncbi:hypothetical protein LCGC14_0629750 [marine sediment metagenome]|uniref:Uncharacterized protein n=1 Tax=marine sediment metagenome TaxID=412755 RepID=A0A0F9R7G3_9ZZZZ